MLVEQPVSENCCVSDEEVCVSSSLKDAVATQVNFMQIVNILLLFMKVTAEQLTQANPVSQNMSTMCDAILAQLRISESLLIY